VPDSVTRFREASEANDIAGIMASLSPDAELVSPLSGRMVFRGGGDLEHLMTAVYGSMRAMRWREEIADGSRRVVLGDCRVGPFRMSDAMVLELRPGTVWRALGG
jgi:hypothetical protein